MLRTVFMLLVLIAVCALVAQAGVKDSLAYQGRLLDASDQPVTGNRDVIFSFWTDSLGGIQLYSEIRTVTVTSGLFNICLGCTSPDAFFAAVAGAPDVFLQVQMGGQAPMVPRTRLRNSPSALVSSRVVGDITTSPAQVAVGDLDGDGFLELSSPPEQAQMVVAHKRPGKAKYNNIVLRAMADSVTDYRDCDSDDDGVIDSRYSATLGHGGGGAGGMVLLEADLNGDGTPENACSSNTDDSSSSVTLTSQFSSGPRQTTSMDGTFSHGRLRCETDSDNDGVADNSVISITTSSSAKHAINTKGTGSAGRSVTSSTSSSNATVLIAADVNGDGIAENTIDEDCDDTDAEFTVAHEVTHVVQQRSGATGASLRISSDHDADGTVDRVISNDCDDNDASIAIDESGVHVAITTNPDSTVFDNERTLSDHKIIHRDLAARNILLSSSSRQTADDTQSVEIRIDSVNGGRAALAIKTKGTSAQRILAQADQDSACIAIDEPGVHVAMSSKGWDGTIKGNVHIIDGAERTVNFDGDGSGYVSKRFGIGIVGPDHPLAVVGGAYCDGANWVNASDANLKENFQPVDGQELLDKIAQLPVSEWNYKTQSDEQKHIGPTAQDFKRVFGVGSDGRAISTIDPSGIALAAIKELNRQNRELKDQNEALKRQLDELTKAVQELSSRK